ncbi:MAG TPA: class I tRNA ligase family protein, partial [Vicinamibacteria bacterium]|nr:class I tRNA ligase family protein [Vicinamibacteria bacterium]
METRFDPKSFEPRWQAEWAARGWFRAEPRPGREPYCIPIPPPNVTGKLHLGHALQSTLQDLLVRWRRMQGYDALWLPGTDHAGIATQLMVERELAAEGTSRLELGRERFLERMWAWKERHHDNIRRQLDRMGASCDWTRERFTLDDGLSRAVREAFVRLHREGLIYRGEYIVNWSPGLDTAISDLEVEMRQVRDRLWHVAYPVEGSDERVVVVTTRPETMLGDTAIAYHPDDERYRRLAGRRAIVPVAGRSIPFVADAAVEREFGSGLVKVTPFHDPADFEIGRRHGLPGIAVIDRHGRMTAAAGAGFEGLTVEAARALLVERLRAEGSLVRDEEYVHNVGFCQRSGVRVEPLVSKQWFCDVSGMAGGALEAWRDG